jgi:DNA invertase Pin-like site-specific DNA recombinase
MKTTFSVGSVPKDIGIWIRVSTLDQANGDSPEHHLARAKDYASARGWTVKEVYDLAGQTGKAVMQHPEAKRMKADIERGHITGLVFSKLARLSRNLREVQDFGDFFQKHKADLISLSEAIDTSTAGGRMFFHLLGVFGQWEREETTERVNASIITRAKLGKPINGRAPYGYRWVDRKLLVHPDEASYCLGKGPAQVPIRTPIKLLHEYRSHLGRFRVLFIRICGAALRSRCGLRSGGCRRGSRARRRRSTGE